MIPPDRLDHLDDEALSAVLDGEGTEDEAAHAAICPTCADRLSAFRTAAAALGQPVAVDPDRRDAAVRAALEAPMAISLDARRWLRGSRLALAGVAAAVVAAVIAVPLLTGDSTPMPSAARAPERALDSQAELRTAAPKAGGVEAFAAPTSPDLGELAGADLRAKLADVPRTAGGPPAPCEDRARATHPAGAQRTLSATATWKGAAAVVIVLRAGGAEHADVVTTATCAIVESIDL
jgi:hypothetical protein